MGHFKSVSKKKKIQRKIILILIEIILFLIVLKAVKKNININEDKLIYLTYNYFGKPNKIEMLKNEAPTFKEERSPTVYIYNTHQTENYKYDKLNSYNIDYSVMFASYILEDYLNKLGIDALVETNLVSKYLKENNLLYKDSYKASRVLMENAYKDNLSLKYFIDLHRDSASYNQTTCEIDEKKYASILFVIGKENDNYLQNELMAQKLKEKLQKKYLCLVRGILEKEGPGVNGIYNQDFNKNVILIEVGGQYNNIEEVKNTLEVFAKVLYEYIMEDEWKVKKSQIIF